TTSTQRSARDERIAASTSGIRSLVAVRRHPAGNGKVAFFWVRPASSASSIRCWVPILVALSRPDLIQRRTVSGSRLVRRAASGTVNIVALYYNKSTHAIYIQLLEVARGALWRRSRGGTCRRCAWLHRRQSNGRRNNWIT